MAFGKRKHKGIKTFILFLLVVIILGGVGASGYVLYQSKIKSLSKTYETEIETLKLDAYALKRTIWMSHEALKAGTIVEAEQLYSGEISSSMGQDQFFSEEDVGKVLLINVEPKVPIMKVMLFDEIIGKDTREEELNMVFLPSNLSQNSFVDVRIGFPNGEDFIVLTKIKVRGVNLESNTLWLWMDEKEMLTLSSAIVDAYLHKGTKLYTVTYVAPTIQDEAIANYPVNVDVLKIIQSNPNILEEAKQELSDELRKLLDQRLSILSEEALSSVDNGIKQEVIERETIIDENSLIEADKSGTEREGSIEPTTESPEQPTDSETSDEGGIESELY